MTNQEEIRAALKSFADRGGIHDLAEDALRELRGYGDEMIPVLLDALKDDPDEEVRLVVIRLFWEMGTDAEPALPALFNSLKDRNRTIRIAAAGIAARFGGRAKAAVPFLQSWIASNDELNRTLAAGSILKIDPTKADDLLPLLIEALASEDDGIKTEAIGQLECLGELAQPAVPSLKNLLGDDDSNVSMFASEALAKITGDASDAIKIGLDLLEADDWMDRCMGCEHLGLLGAKAHSAAKRLRWAAIDDENEAVRDAAHAALYKIES